MALLLTHGHSSARIWEVGSGRELTTPSAAARLVGDGDTVVIDAGIYRDCAVWKAERLAVRTRGGMVELRDVTCQDKAIWVIAGRDVTIENIRFVGAKVRDRNGAGIRLEPDASLTVRNSEFIANELGLLAGNGERSQLSISNCLFSGNGPSHGLYVNFIGRLEVRDSLFRNQIHKHHIKSRARETIIIGNEIDDGASGSSSYLIDLPNGGTARIADNRLHKGARSENSIAIAVGQEGAILPSHGIAIVGNNFVSRRAGRAVFVHNATPIELSVDGNRLTGAITLLQGRGIVVTAPHAAPQ